MLIFKIWYIILRVPLKRYFNDLINAETLFDDIKSKKLRFEDAEKKKKQTEFESKLSSVRIGGNKSDKHPCEIENITKFTNRKRRLLDLIMIILKW